mmetsp:Transcript_30001/g.43668  ORF Transcript_30001/g.43668 Transcript_30001/m.43668 type:complete len:94 (-) Transcript_30001:1007-1288(-)
MMPSCRDPTTLISDQILINIYCHLLPSFHTNKAHFAKAIKNPENTKESILNVHTRHPESLVYSSPILVKTESKSYFSRSSFAFFMRISCVTKA